MRHVLFDTETTGLNFNKGDRVVEIGAVEMLNGALTGKTFHVYVNPQRSMPDGAFQVHKISTEFLRDKPLFSDPSVGQAFHDFITDAVLVAHNASFDMGFMQMELKKAGLPQLENEVVDTVKIARKRFPGSPAKLDALCARFGIDTKQRERDGHGALLDARLLAEVYIELTGGAQVGLSFDGSRNGEGPIVEAISARPERLKPLRCLVTDEEQDAHNAFIAEMDNPIWQKT